MGKLQYYGQGTRLWRRYKVGGNLSTSFPIKSVGYTLSSKGTVCGQSTRMWENYKDVGNVQG